MVVARHEGRRRRLDAQAWREVFGRFDDAGLTVGEFCRREGVSASSFHRWRLRVQAAPTQGGIAAPDCAAAAPPSFVELGTLGVSATGRGGGTAAAACWEIRLDLGGGLSLQLLRR